MDNQQYGVIHEIGDMNMGFTPMNNTDQQIYAESINSKKEDSQQVVNEEKKD
jgi:hypothetical protein